MTHWARAYVTKRWTADGNGPDSFSCWGLVRAVYRARLGIELPAVAINDAALLDANVRAIKTAARLLHMRPIGAQGIDLREMDIVLMSGSEGLHCGVIIAANGGLCLLHSAHGAGVLCERLSDACCGRRILEVWRVVA